MLPGKTESAVRPGFFVFFSWNTATLLQAIFLQPFRRPSQLLALHRPRESFTGTPQRLPSSILPQREESVNSYPPARVTVFQSRFFVIHIILEKNGERYSTFLKKVEKAKLNCKSCRMHGIPFCIRQPPVAYV